MKQALLLFFNPIWRVETMSIGVSYFNFNAFQHKERYENCMIGTSSLKLYDIRHIRVQYQTCSNET